MERKVFKTIGGQVIHVSKYMWDDKDMCDFLFSHSLVGDKNGHKKNKETVELLKKEIKRFLKDPKYFGLSIQDLIKEPSIDQSRILYQKYKKGE